MEFTFKVTEQEANILIQALGELPAKTSMSVIGKIQFQASEQMKRDEDPTGLDTEEPVINP